MKLLFLLVCVMVVTIVLASSPLVQVNIGTDTIANALCDDNNNNCQQNQGNGNGGGNNGGTGTGNTGNTGNTGDSSDSSSEDGSSDDSSSEESSSDDSDDSGNTGNDSNPDNTGNTGDTGDDTGNTGNTGDNTGNTGNTGDNTGNTGTTGNGTSSALPPGGEYSGDTSNYCFLEVEDTCSAQQNALYCKSSYGDFDPMAAQFSQMVRNVMRHSYEYLALYIQHSNYLVNRKGFAKLFRELSDYKWNLAKYTISYITERGGVMQFSPPPPPCDCTCEDSSSSEEDSSSVHSMLADLIDGPVEDSNGGSNGTGTTSSSDPGEYTGNPDGYQLSEILSLAFSNDIEKEVAIAADGLHLIAVGTTGHDVQSAMYLQETYVQPHRVIVGNLARYVNILSQMLTTIDQMVALYHFDDLLWSFSVFE